MTEEYRIDIYREEFSFSEILTSNGKVFRNILGIDWRVRAELIKKMVSLQNIPSIKDVSFFSSLLKTTVKYTGLKRKVLAQIKLSSCLLQNMTVNLICDEGSNTVYSEEKFDANEEIINWETLNCELSLHVSPENFFYFKFCDDTSLIETDVTESSQNVVSELANDFNELYKKQYLADVIIRCGDAVFKAHKVILTSRSPVFAAMFQHRMIESEENVIDIKDMDSNVLSILLEFIYCGKLDRLSVQTAVDLLSASRQYRMAGLKIACISFLLCAMAKDNVLSILSLADLRHDFSLKKVSIDFVCKEFDHLKDTEEWKRFQKEKPILANEVLLNIIGFASQRGHKLRSK